MSARILVVDDEKLIRWSLFERLTEDGYEVVSVPDCASAKNQVDSDVFDVVLLDLQLPDGSGMDVLRHIQSRGLDAAVIIITAYSTVDSAVDAMKLGAEDYLAKPFNLDEISVNVGRVLENRNLRSRMSSQVAQDKERFGLHSLIGESESILQIKALVKKVAGANSTVLLLGESGTGKDLVARAIHYESKRAEKAFVNVSCTALPESLLESEIFGHERGAFTDARELKRGLFELAEGGTIYFDEVGDMNANLQAKFLRLLEEKTFRRIGGARDITVDARVVAATNRNLEEAIADGHFREDLYFRLSTVPIEMPALRERRGDIPALVNHFLAEYSREFRREIPRVDAGAMEKLMHHNWPGNVRELRNAIERAVLLSSHDELKPEDFVLLSPGTRRSVTESGYPFALPAEGCSLDDVERQLVEQALARTQGNQTHAAELLGISRDQMRYKIQKYHLVQS